MITMVDEKVAAGSNAQDERIFVAIRIRPLSDKERARNDICDWEFYNDNTIVLKSGQTPESFTFDRVFSDNCSTREVYENGIKEVALSVVHGLNSSIFAYGQTSSGKTYTMGGVTECAVSDIYDYIEMHRNREFVVRFSAVEIYNEVVTDLLSEDATALRLQDDPEKGTVIERLTEQTLRDRGHLQELISICEAHRKTGETSMNQTSSRSHQILRLSVESLDWDDLSSGNSGTLAASVSFVDLAGSERASQTLSAGARLREGSHINRSLLTLGTVIRKLSKGGDGHIPYRDSKLTRILQNSLGGNARTAIICTASPARSRVDQSRNTLIFASCAKQVTNTAQVNLLMSDKAVVKQLRRELEKLELEMKNLAPSSIDSSSLLREKELLIEQMAKEIEELSRQQDLAESRIQVLLESTCHRQQLGVDECLAWKTFTAVNEDIEELTDQQNMVKSEFEAVPLLDEQDRLLPIDQEASVGSSAVEEQDIGRTTSQREIAQSCPDHFPSPVEHKRLLRIITCPAYDSQAYAENIMNDLEEPTSSSNGNDSETNDGCLHWHSCHKKGNANDSEINNVWREVRCIETKASRTNGEAQLSTSVSETTEEKSSNGTFKNEDGTVSSREVYNEVDDTAEDYTFDAVKQKFKDLQRTNNKLVSLLPPQESPVAMDNEISIASPNTMCRGGYITRTPSLAECAATRRHSQISDLSATLEEECTIDSDEDTTCDINFMRQMNDKARLQFTKDFDEIMVNAKAPKSRSRKDASIQIAEGAFYLNSRNRSSDLEKQWRDIIKLWDACNVTLVHRSHFLLLFKGDPSGSPYLEIELRRLCFLRDSFATGTEIMEDNQKITWDSSAKAINKERKMLSKQVRKKFWRKERERIYEKWGINLKSKNRSAQLACLLWSKTQDIDHIKDSAALVAKLVCSQKQNQAPKEMLGLTFSLRKYRRASSWKDSMSLLSFHL